MTMQQCGGAKLRSLTQFLCAHGHQTLVRVHENLVGFKSQQRDTSNDEDPSQLWHNGGSQQRLRILGDTDNHPARQSGFYSDDRHLNEPIGTFEPMCLDDLDQVVYVDQVTPDGFSRSSCANGTAPRSDEKAPDDQTDTTRGAADASPQEEPGANAQDASSTSSTSGSVSEDPVDKTASLSNGIDLLMDSTGEEEQNQANSPTVCPTDTFFDVNLEVVAQSEPSESPGENP
ncbi:hypothetical protein fugu_001916 [Takifugu bimaculatus]|uniref:Uncharacterized protein n=1 Tax=Takifugu bimaculatus TaxID=433685 RepID=A0A4Z2BR22_9TELE|nr:hypothetical protein fugu_001916 [Takifugu bimaculatus]